MTAEFDPYYKWLGIPPKDQPPHHYRLLGIELFESDPDVIGSAADQRMAHVRSFQTGKNAEVSQKILNELAAAQICLLNAKKKTEYDRCLENRICTPPGAGAASAMSSQIPQSGTDSVWFPSSRRVFVSPAQRRGPWVFLTALALLSVVLGVAVALLLQRGHSPPSSPSSKISKKKTIPKTKETEIPEPTERKEPVEIPVSEGTPPKPVVAPKEPPEFHPLTEPFLPKHSPQDDFPPSPTPIVPSPPFVPPVDLHPENKSAGPREGGSEKPTPPPRPTPLGPPAPAPKRFAIALPEENTFDSRIFDVNVQAAHHALLQAARQKGPVLMIRSQGSSVDALAGVTRGTLLNGNVLVYYPNHQMMTFSVYKEGRRDGLVKTWHDNGHRCYWGQYTRGFRNGFCCFFKNDAPCLLVEYTMDRIDAIHYVTKLRVVKSFATQEEALADPQAGSSMKELQELNTEMARNELEFKETIKKEVARQLRRRRP